MDQARVPVVRCQQRLLILWVSLFILAVVMLLVQSTPQGVYYRQASDIWDWFLPIVIPTVSLMVGTFIAQAREEESSATVSRISYLLAFGSSLLFFVLILGLLLAFAGSDDVMAELKKLSKLVAAMQTLVGISLGAFFVSKKS